MSKLLTTSEMKDISTILSMRRPKYIVVDGYNAVGKSVFLESLLEKYNFRLYRPSYDTWAYRIPQEFRWAIFGSFLNVSQELDIYPNVPVVFDRGFFSGVVYNNDRDLAHLYKNIVKDFSLDILHILITCDESDYNKFLAVRKSEKPLYYKDCVEYTARYEEAYHIAGADYIVYRNIFDESRCSNTCSSCSHYTFHDNKCHNTLASHNGILNVSPHRERCPYSHMKEVQDNGELSELLTLSK